MAELVTLEEVASYLRVTPKTIYRLLERQAIPAAKVGRQWRFDKAAIDNWLRQSPTDKEASILVIDDDETICSLFKDILEETNYQVTTISNSSKGLELIKDNDYDLVFLDLKMPGMDGAELFRQIKAVKPELPVTIITAYPESELMAKALEYGPMGIMKKPFRRSDILTAANNYLRFGVSTK